MPNFFCEYVKENPIIKGKDAVHISKSLRMKPGEMINISDTKGTVYLCRINTILADQVILEIVEKQDCESEPDIDITLYQGLVKGDKASYIIQKSVELGVKEIVFLAMQRSVSKPDNKSIDKKLKRWNDIALNAASQSGRGYIPKVRYIGAFDEALSESKERGLALFFYELGGVKVKQAVSPLVEKKETKCSIFIGPEGGFSLEESDKLRSNKAIATTLGKRILRTETAPIAALSIIMYLTDNMN